MLCFGARGDGKTDDTAAIETAVREGRSVYFPPGEYRITRTIRIELDAVGFVSIFGDGTARVVMEGEGPAFLLIGTHDGTADPATVKPSVWKRQRMPIVRDLEIVGKHPKADGVAATGVMQLLVSGLNVRDARHGLHLQNRNRNVIVADCHFYDNRGVGIFLDKVNLHQINVSNSHISYNDAGGIVVSGGNVRNLQVNGCDIEGNMGDESKGACNILLDCRNGSVAEAAIVGCTIQHTRQAADSANIRLRGNGIRLRGDASAPASFGNVAISNNVLSDVQYNIDLDGVRGVSIVGNTLWKGFRCALRIRRSSRIAIGSNVIDRNPQYQDLNGSRDQVLIEDSEHITVQGLQASNIHAAPAAMVIRRCQWVNMTGCSLTDCASIPLRCERLVNSRISDCLLSGSQEGHSAGLQIVDGKRLQVANNLIRGEWATGGEAIELQGNLRVD